MTALVVTGNYRRIKTAFFLTACCWLGAFPHWIDPERNLYPAFTLAILLGGYGLRTVLRKSRKLTNSSQVNLTNVAEKEFLPTIDVLVAARDEEAVLSRLVNRLNLLNYPKEKLSTWIVDDGSQDGTSSILNELTKQFSTLNVIRRSRFAGGGKSGALNEALKHLKADWLLILDADAQLQEDVLLRLVDIIQNYSWSAVQLRKSVINASQNPLTCCQAMEMAMDAVIQEGRLSGGGVVELRGNGQFLKRAALDKCGGFNEDTVTDDLDLSFRLLILGELVGILWDPPVEEEAVLSIPALLKQRQRWAEGGLQRFFDYWHLLTSSKINFTKKKDLTCFFLLQYALPVISFADLLTSFFIRVMPVYWPLSLVAFGVSGFAYWKGCYGSSEGPKLPSPKPLNIFMATIYLVHWFIIIPWITLKMAILPKKLVWEKTKHVG